MIGSYIDFGNPLSDHPLNYGTTAFWCGLAPYDGGPTWRDLRVGNRYTLEANNGAPTRVSGWGPPGFVGANGGGGYWRFLSAPSGVLVAADTFSWEVFYYHKVASTTQALMSSANVTHYLRVNASNCIDVLLSNTYLITTGSTALTVGRWYHILLTVAASGALVLYVNGVPDATATQGGVAGTNFYIGIENGSFSVNQGCFGGAAVIARPLSASEAAAREVQWRQGFPDMLRRWSRRTWVFGGNSGGGEAVATQPQSARMSICIGLGL